MNINVRSIFQKPGIWTNTKFYRQISDQHQFIDVECEPMQATEIRVKVQHHTIIITASRLYIEYFEGEPLRELEIMSGDFDDLKIESARLMFDEEREVERWLKSL